MKSSFLNDFTHLNNREFPPLTCALVVLGFGIMVF